MNKFILISILMISALSMHGQSLIGIYGGYNRSWFFYNDNTPYYHATYDAGDSYIFGINLKERKTKLVNLAIDLDYLRRTMHANASSGGKMGGTGWDVDVDIHSINIRVLPEFKFGKKFGVFFNTGPYLGVIVASRIKGTSISSDYQSPPKYRNIDRKGDNFKLFDFGISASIGVEIPITESFKVLLDANYKIGISDISDTQILADESRFNSETLYLSIGVVYLLKNFTLTNWLKEHHQ